VIYRPRMAVDVRKATAADKERVTKAFVGAFSEDPLFRWMFRDKPDLPRRLQRFFGVVVGGELRREDHEVYIAGDGAGASVWKGVGKWKAPASEFVRTVPAMLRAFGPTNLRGLRVLTAMEKLHPTEEHYYLEVLGCDAAHQGKGVGSAVISSFLERCDREGLPAYLESSNVRNIPFYARHGFQERERVPLPEGAPPLTPMWRPAR
jgi:GNAT superfamily N-acetyltransferase